MCREVPGMYVPEAVVRRLRGVPEDRVGAEGLALCSEILAQVKDISGVAGVHVMAVNWEDAVPEILERAGVGPRRGSSTGMMRSG
jgi:methylenetetrahydrofolate reductase (NADPH)